MSDIVEQVVCKVDDLQIKEKKVIRIENVGIVLYRKGKNEFIAFGNKCSHYGAPLINGVIYEDYVICPWHAACFNIYSGDIEEFPGCNNIPTFNTYVKGGEVYLKASKDIITSVQKFLNIREISNKSTFLIIGGGPAGFQCADTLRQEGFDGRIVLVTAEDSIPYDRTKLSKNLASKIGNIILRNDDYYKQSKIEIILKTSCKRLDIATQMAHFDDGSNLNYDKIFIATGSSPKKYQDLSLDNLKNVFYLRTYLDANNIHNQIENKDVVLIGSSFIVIEIACSINKLAKSISIISRTEVPFAKTLGLHIGNAIKKILISKNIQFYIANSALTFNSERDILQEIKSDTFNLPVDVCVIGIGSYPNSEFLKDTDIKLNSDSYIEVNQQFQTSVDNVYAGGDVVIYPNPIFNNRMMNIAHWQTAQAHGRFASLYMLNKTPKFKSVPFFWSTIFGKGIRFSGIIEDPDNCLIDGDLEELSLVAYYFNSENQVVGVATISKDPLASAFAAMLRSNKILTKQDIESNGNSWFKNNFN